MSIILMFGIAVTYVGLFGALRAEFGNVFWVS